jgi:hypothetical protein
MYPGADPPIVTQLRRQRCAVCRNKTHIEQLSARSPAGSHSWSARVTQQAAGYRHLRSACSWLAQYMLRRQYAIGTGAGNAWSAETCSATTCSRQTTKSKEELQAMAIPQPPHLATVTLVTPEYEALDCSGGGDQHIMVRPARSTLWGLAYYRGLCLACLEVRQRDTYQ